MTNDQLEALVISDRVIVMNRGRIEQIGAPREIYERPASAFVADFIGVTNLLKGTAANGGEEGEVALELGHRLCCPLPAGVVPGGPVLLSIRPEDLEVRRAPGPAGTDFGPGRVTKVMYLGGAQECWVTIREHSLRVQVMASFGVTTGEDIYLACNLQRIAVLRG